jgi:hypothetical protein
MAKWSRWTGSASELLRVGIDYSGDGRSGWPAASCPDLASGPRHRDLLQPRGARWDADRPDKQVIRKSAGVKSSTSSRHQFILPPVPQYLAPLRKRDLEEHDELKGFVKDANAEIRCEPLRSQQQRQVLKGSQRAMKGSVSHIITVGLKDFQNRMLQTDFKVMTSVVPDSSKTDLHTRLACGQVP